MAADKPERIGRASRLAERGAKRVVGVAVKNRRPCGVRHFTGATDPVKGVVGGYVGRVRA